MKFLKSILIILLLCASQGHDSMANELRFDRFSVEDGLNHEVVRGIVQGPSGFLWIATEGGLIRFDGFTFVEFKYQEESKQSSNVIYDILIDGNGTIWLGTLGSGVLKFDPVTHEFDRVLAEQLTSSQVPKIFMDSNQQIWVGTLEEGLNLIKQSSDGLELVKFSGEHRGPSHPSITAFAEDNLGRIWIGTDGGGVDIYQPATESWQNINIHSAQQGKLSGNRIRSLFTDDKGDIWIGTAGSGLNKYVFAEKKIIHFTHNPDDPLSLGNNRILNIFQDKQRKLWLGTDGGISIFNGQQFENIQSARFKANSLSHNRVLSIYQDSAGLMWFGTYNGLNKWNPTTSFFNHNIPQTRKQLDHSNVLDFSTDSKGNLFVATYGGGVAVLEKTGVWQSISDEDGLPNNSIVSLLVDNEDGLWVGTYSDGLWYKEVNSSNWQQFKHDADDSYSLPASGITDILQDSRGTIWVSTFSGGISKKTENGFNSILKTQGKELGLSSKNVFQILEDQDGFIWLATDNGLNLVDPDDFSVQHFLPDLSQTDGLHTELTWHLFEDSSGNFWIATQGHGIYIWDYQQRIQRNPKFRHMSTSDGLPHETVYGIKEDSAGNIWLSSARGLAKIDSRTSDITSFNVSHGLQGYDFNLGASYADNQGNIYFGGTNGFNRFRAEEIRRNQIPPKVTLLNIFTFDDRITLPLAEEQLLLEHSDYLVAFDFVGLDFAAPEKNQYQYQLQPFDENWIYVGNLRRATYTNLPPGKYTFKVRAANNDGFWSEPQINLPVQVIPAPWKTPLAYSIYALLVVFALFLLLRAQMKKLAKEELHRKQLEKQVAERTAELAQQNKVLTQLNQKLEEANSIDTLTGCNNRYYLEEYLRLSLPQYTEQNTHSRMLVLLIDLDNLKTLNDSLGHAAGDALISFAAKVFADNLSPELHLVRWGGDEFMVVGDVKSTEDSLHSIERLRQNIEDSSFEWLNTKVQLSCSMGFAHYPFDSVAPKALSWDQVTMIADKALYSAKEKKGVSWCGVIAPKRDINELYLSELLHCQRITQLEDLVEIARSD